MSDLAFLCDKVATLDEIRIGQIFIPMANSDIVCVKLFWGSKNKLPQTGKRVRCYDITSDMVIFAPSTTIIKTCGRLVRV